MNFIPCHQSESDGAWRRERGSFWILRAAQDDGEGSAGWISGRGFGCGS